MSSSTTGGSSRTTGAKRDTILFSNFEKVIRLDSTGSHSNFEVIDEPAAAYQNTPTAGKITGFGDEYDTCGDTQPHFCSECGEPVRDADGELVQIGETCWRQECPRCGSGWAMRAGIPITSKMESLRKEVARQRGKSPKFHHVSIIMPTFSTARDDADDALFQVAKGVIDEVGVNVFGGALIEHPYTGDDDDEEDDLDKWKGRCFAGRDWEGDVEDELKEWHHIHALVLADSIDHLSCEALHDKTGILTHRIQDTDDDTNVSLYGVQELAEAATYCLSHARLADDADAYRYFGEVANHSADHRIEARCREVVRSIVPKTLDLQPAGYLCEREIGREEIDKLPNLQRYQNDNDDNSDQDEQTDDSEDASEDTDTGSESTQESTETAESDKQDTESDSGEDTQSPTEDDTVESDENADEDTEDEESTDSDDTEDSNAGCGVHCNGRLVPFEYAPSFLNDDEQELEYEDELRAAYDEWSSPENQDITSFVAPE